MKNAFTTILLLAFPSVVAALNPFAALVQKPTNVVRVEEVVVVSPFENELGAQEPLGFWDPLGVVADGNQTTFDRLRYVELKHGRIAMLAVVGYLATQAGWRVPAFADLPCGFDALWAIPGPGFQQILVFIGLLESEVMKDVIGGEFIGDFRNGLLDFGWDTFDDETKLKKRAIELNQGRAAMMGILALMVHEMMGVSLIPAGVKIEIIMKQM
ncbi:Fucoxanthin-chlorophyll a-c binding protein [Seminavis robusta]|uniref:Fucoxanthin-chlorophyll a-c binding protein n=1 Tax=Seminavis robusta TaxID=568900 RepID=A0A9N8H5H6_9STRA|nr:Fucoxanthin-chlorophyll a-c binding protein [Seminavis robusta]|eukprot:Sro86_g045670.1 Fucoxanthin-chlorophyll a-c binding protein (213) ;mRNA; f:41856-42494